MTIKELRDALNDYLVAAPEAANDPVVFSPSPEAEDVAIADVEYGYLNRVNVGPVLVLSPEVV